jgi:hypothetical protein
MTRHAVNAVIIEEDIADQITDGTVGLPDTAFAAEQIAAYPVRGSDGRRDAALTAELATLYAKLEDITVDIGEGEHPETAVARRGLTRAEAKRARKLTHKRRVPDRMYPGMPWAERHRAAQDARFNGETLPKLVAALRAFAEIAEAGNAYPLVGDERLWVERGKLRVPGFRQLHDQFTKYPVIWASATTRPDRARLLIPNITVIEPPRPAAPHQRVHLISGAWGKSALQRNPRKADDLVSFMQIAMLGKRNGLVISHLDQERALSLSHDRRLHHGAVAGDDDHGDVDALFVIGGPFPSPAATNRIACAEARCRVPYAAPERASCTALLADGSGVTFDRMAYADPRLQSVHAGVYDGGIVQALGRARGLNRTAANPVDIYVLANTPLDGIPLASIQHWRDVKPNRVQMMHLRGAVYTNAADMHRFYPDMFPSEDAARQAIRRMGGAGALHAEARRLAIMADDARACVTFQPPGQGYHPRWAYLPQEDVAALKTMLERKFGGKIINWKVLPLASPAPPSPGGEDRDTYRITNQIPDMSRSSVRTDHPMTPFAGSPPPRAFAGPPDG